MPMDTVLTLKQWIMICPESVERDFVLCASCIVRRVSKLPDAVGLDCRISLIRDYHVAEGPGGIFFQFMKACDAEEEGGPPAWPNRPPPWLGG
jgi:hypothetical protein